MAAMFVAVLLLSLWFGLDSILDYVLQAMGQSHKKAEALKMLTPARFVFLQLSCVFLASLFAVAAYRVKSIYPYVSRLCFYIKQAFRNILADAKTVNALLVLAIPFFCSVYFALTLPVSYDEAYTYLFFTSKPVYVSALFYPAPNNHVLYSLLASVADCIPFLNPLLCLRLPSLLISLLLNIVAYSFIKRCYGEKLAMFVVAVFSMLFLSVYYSYMGRGYTLMLLFFVIAFYAVHNILRQDNKTKDWAFFSIASVLGFYTIPSFLYAFVTLNIVILLYNYKHIGKQVIYNLLVSLGVAVLYLPIIVINGFGALANNRFVTSEHNSRFDVLQKLPSFFYNALGEISGLPAVFIVGLLLLILILFIKNNDGWGQRIWLVFVLSPFVLLFLHNVVPFHRTFMYYGFVIVFMLGLSVRSYIDKTDRKWLIVILILLQIGGFVNFGTNIGEYERFNLSAKGMNDQILQPRKTYYADYDALCTTNLQFEIETNDCYSISQLDVSAKHTKLDADTILLFDYVVVGIKNDETKHRKPFYSDRWQNVYKR